MTDPTPTRPPTPRWRRLLAGLAWVVVGFVGLVALLVAGGLLYLGADGVKRVEGLGLLGGGRAEFRALRLAGWRDYPSLRISVDSLRVFAAPNDLGPAEWLHVGQGDVVVRLDVFGDTLAVVDSLRVRGGGVHFVTGRQQPGDARRALGRDGQSAGDDDAPGWWEELIVLDPALTPTVEDFSVRYERPDKGHDIAAQLRSLRVDSLRTGDGLAARLRLDAHLGGLQFNPREGAWGRDADLTGTFRVGFAGDSLVVRADDLVAGGNRIRFAADYYPQGAPDTSRLVFALDTSVLARARPLLAPGIAEQLTPYDVEGPFWSRTLVYLPRDTSELALVHVDFELRGNRASVLAPDGRSTFRFADVHADARFTNALELAGALDRDRIRGSRVRLDTVRAGFLGLRVSARDALITAPLGGSPRIAGTVHARGAAQALADLVPGSAYAFPRGTARIRARLDGPLDDVPRLLMGSTATLALDGPTVAFREAGFALPLAGMRVEKFADSTTFRIAGTAGSLGHGFTLAGSLRPVDALLVPGYPGAARTRVRLHAPRLDWREALELFGEDEGLSDAEGAGGVDRPVSAAGTSAEAGRASAETPEGDGASAKTRDGAGAATVANLKDALRQVQRSFDPDIELTVDTLTYYGYALYGFRSGVHFDADSTLVLERSGLTLGSGGEVAFRGRLALDEQRRTGFAVDLEARQLDLAAVLPALDYFGQDFLREVERLPNDVDLTLRQRGVLDDVQGLLPNRSRGELHIVSNGDRPFRARVEFEPDRPGVTGFESTRARMSGSPELFNGFFGTERFRFAGGTFDFAVGYGGLVPSLRELVGEHPMRLDVRDAGVRIVESGVTVPITRLSLDHDRDTAEVYLAVRDTAYAQEIHVNGTARNLSELVLGETGKHFSSALTLHSPRISWGQLGELFAAYAPEPEASAEPIRGANALTREVQTRRLPRRASLPREEAATGAVAARTRSTPASGFGESPSDTERGFGGSPSDTASGADALDLSAELVDAGLLEVADLPTRRARRRLTAGADPAAGPGLRRNLRALMLAFDPELTICIDTLALTNEFVVRDVHSGLRMDSTYVVHLDTTALRYRDGAAMAYGRIGLADLAYSPFTVHAESDALDLASLVEGLDHLGSDELRAAEELSGVLGLRADYSGAIEGTEARLTPAQNRGTVALDLRDLGVAGLPSLDTLAAKFMQRERLDTVRFAPIETVLEIRGTRVDVPLTEVQSNGFNVFAHGQLGLTEGDSTNLWLSVPLANLFRDVTDEAPPREGWAERKLKVHVQLLDGPDSESATRLRLSKRRFYKERGRLDEWRALERRRERIRERQDD